MHVGHFGRVAATLSLASWFLTATANAQGAIERVSVSNSGAEANGRSTDGRVSADERFVLFVSEASNLVAGDTNSTADIFLRDRLFGTTECISRAPNGDIADGASIAPRMSDDGRVLAFMSAASNLVPGDLDPVGSVNAYDIYVYERASQSMKRISRRTSGAEVSAHFKSPVISGDGRVVAFESPVDLATGATVGSQIWAYDVASGTLSRADAALPGQVFARLPSLSNDGSIVTYRSELAGSNGRQIFGRNLVTGTTELVSVFSNGVHGNWDSDRPSISADGRFVAFDSLATNDYAPAASGSLTSRVYVRDRVAGTTELVSVNSLGEASISHCNSAVISPDGRRVAFYSNEQDFVPGDASTGGDALVFDRATQSLTPLGTSASGGFALEATSIAAFRADNAQVVLISASNNLVAGDTNGHFDVFLKDVTPLIPAPYCTAQVNSRGCTSNLTSSGLPSASSSSAFLVEARELINRRHAMLFYGFAPNAVPFNGGTLCVAAPLKRTAPQPTGGNPTGVDCSGAIAFDFNALIRSGNVPELVVGTVVYAQVTYGDVGGTYGRAQSDGLAFTVLP